VAGEAGVGSPPGEVLTASSFVLGRYTSNGQLDTSFGSNGTVITTLSQGQFSFVSALIIQSDGKIVAAGNTATTGQGFVDNFAVARYLAQ